MTTVKRRQLPVRPGTAPGHRATEPHRTAVLVVGGIISALVAGAFAVTGPGIALLHRVFHFLEFYCGVASLVALSLTVMIGLAAIDRTLLQVRHRVLLQGAHRALASTALFCLGVHIATKVVEGHAGLLDVVVPFLAAHRPLWVGLGTLAGYLMVGVTVTGVVRGRFAGTSRVWLWRVLHCAAYLCWPVSLLHGLNAGRPAKGWVTASYLLCLLVVGLGLLARGWAAHGHRVRGPRTQTTATMRPVGKPAPPVRTSIVLPPPDRPRRTAPVPPTAAPPDRPRRTAAPVPPTAARPAEPRRAEPAPPVIARTAPKLDAAVSDDEFWEFMRGAPR